MSEAGTERRFPAGEIRLDTPRLVLRLPGEDDLADILAIFSDPDVTRFWSGSPWSGMDEARAWLARMRRGQAEGTGLLLVLEARDSGHVIGDCTVFDIHHTRRAEIGYALGRPFWGQGLMHEALTALVDYAFGPMDLRRLEADIDPANSASRRSLERLGFVREGLLRERWEVEGRLSDSEMFGLLRSAWRADHA